MDHEEDVNLSRRRFLTWTTTGFGVVGGMTAAVPFLNYWNPSARAQAAGAPVEQDISKLRPGQVISLEWRGKPIIVYRRSESELETLDALEDKLRDPDSEVDQQPEYATNKYRSRSPEVGVLIAICTHLGCSPKYRPEVGSVSEEWQGGFYCPCHGSKFDLAGRVYKGVPAPTNLAVPPHWFPSEDVIVVGEDGEGGAA